MHIVLCYLSMLHHNPYPWNLFFFYNLFLQVTGNCHFFQVIFFVLFDIPLIQLACNRNFSFRSTVYAWNCGFKQIPVLVLACWISRNLWLHLFCSILWIIDWNISTVRWKNSKVIGLFNCDLYLRTEIWTLCLLAT